MIPKLIEKQVVEWYHNALCNQGETCTELSRALHFYWKNLYKTVHDVCSKCKACQFLKRNGKLPLIEVESKPCDVLCEDLIGQFQFTPKGRGKKCQMTTTNGKTTYLQAAYDRFGYILDRNVYNTFSLCGLGI